MKKVINTETNEVIERELTSAEIKQEEKDNAKIEKETAEKAAQDAKKAEAKAELLARLGITAEEAKTLLS